jgi:type IV secretion system protein VirD4
MNAPRRPVILAGAALLAVAAGYLFAQAGHPLAGAILALAGTAPAALTVYLKVHPSTRSKALIGAWDRKTRRHGGTASRWDIAKTSSGWAMRRRAAVVRPSLHGVSRRQRWRAPLLSYATPLARVGGAFGGRVGGQTVWTSCEESTLRVGIPGTGKTAELACRVIDAPGGVIVTSTATDLHDLTAPLRARRGPVAVFNPGGIGAVTSTLRWSPLVGCEDPHTAARRAVDLMGPPQSGEGERWAIQGRRVLSVFLHAAALGGHRMRDVAGWVAWPDAAKGEILAALDASPQAAEMRQVAEHTINTTPRTRDGVMLAIAPALAWTTLPAAAASGAPDPHAEQFSVRDLTDRSGALYLLGDDDGTVAPLVGALVAEITHQARAVAAARPGGRLDPALTMCLDEIALVCPTPLDRWMAELRKRSIVIHAACQGLGQLRQRWGDNGASMILNSAAALLVFGGCKDATDLDLFGRLTGDREEITHVRDADGRITSTSTRRVPVISPAMLASLANHRALLIRRGMPCTLVRTPIGWKRRDVKRTTAQARTAAPARQPLLNRFRRRPAKAAARA